MRITNILLALLFPIIGNAQVIKGVISDVNGKQIESAVVISQKSDSTYIDATTTDKNGEFIFKNGTYPYILFVQHMSYKNYSIKSEENNISLVLEEKEHLLEDVVVVARKPIVSIKDNGAASFNIQQLIKNKPVTNALDLIGEIPGVQKTGSDYSIIGTIGTSIVINGRKSNMTASQIKDFLSSISPEQVSEIEIFYSTPPQFGVKGASINVKLKRERTEKIRFSGNVYTTARVASHYSQSFGANMMMSNKRFSWDIGYAGGKNKTEYRLDLESNHNFEEKNYDIALKTQQMFDHFSHKLFSNFDVDFRKDESLNISYTGQFTDPNTDYMSELRMDGQKSFSENLMHGGMQLHSLDLAYKYKKVNIGIDYLNYNEDSEQRLNGWMTESDMSELHRSQSEQRLNKYKLYINNSNRVWGGSLTYSAETFYSSTYNEHITETDNLYGDDKSYDLKQNELSISAYIGYGCKLGKKGMLNFSVKGEYFKSVVEQMGRNNTLWEDFNVYPNMTLVYRAIPRMTLQFSLASNKNYPAYWITNPNRSYMNPYSVTEENPFLKPYESYQVNLT